MWILTILLISISILWRYIATDKLRSTLKPWALAVLMCNATSGHFYTGGLHAIIGLLSYSAWIICLDGFHLGSRKYNRVWSAFTVFWGYLMLSSFMGHHAFQGVASLLNTYVSTFCVGYYMSIWVCRTEGALRRISQAIIVASFLIGILYLRHGAFVAMDRLNESREVFDVSTFDDESLVVNVNATALALCAILPFLLVAVMTIECAKFKWIYKCLGVFGLLICISSLVKTGSRNGGIALLPLGWYLFFSTKNQLKKKNRRLLFLGIALLSVVLIAHMMRGSIGLRALQFFGAARVDKNVSIDELSSSRVSWWIEEYESMTPMQAFLGRGFEEKAFNPVSGRVFLMNYHSIYVFILLQSGFIGVFLMLVVIGMFIVTALQKGDRGRMSMMFMGVWVLTGIGEANGITGGATAILAGFAIGLCSDDQVRNTEMMNDKERKILYVQYYGGVS